MNTIGTLQEGSLHSALRRWYAQPGDQFEVPLNGFIIDIVRHEQLIEIQTRNFAAIKRKLTQLTDAPERKVRLVFPIAMEKWIVRLDVDEATQLTRRKSPRRGRIEHLFTELIHFPQLVRRPNLKVEVVFVREEEVWLKSSTARSGKWHHRGWRRHDRRLLDIVACQVLEYPDTYRGLLPAALPTAFTNLELSRTLGVPRDLAQRMTYCLRNMGVLSVSGKQGSALVFEATIP